MRPAPPSLSLTARWLSTMLDAASRWGPSAAGGIIFSALAIALLLDYVTGAYINLMILFLLIAAFATWLLGEAAGAFVGILAIGSAAAIRHYQLSIDPHHAPAHHLTEAINSIGRLLATLLVVTLVNGQRSALALVRWRASTDGLTGVLNSSAFYEALRESISRGRQAGQAVVLAYIDLDGFKHVNDRFGHSAGDGVLRTFATAATDIIRADDLFARVGGDEFVVLLTVRNMEEGDRTAEAVHARLTAKLVENGMGVTCSMGALVMDCRSLDPDAGYVELADKLMYEVKNGGKNALRIGRIDPIGAILRSHFTTPIDNESFKQSDLDQLLRTIDNHGMQGIRSGAA